MNRILKKIKAMFKNQKIMLTFLGGIVFTMTVVIVNYSFGFTVSNNTADETDTFPEGYILSKNDCINSQGNKVENSVNYDGDTITVEPSQTVFCKLAFDVPDSKIITYDPSKSHAQDSEGRECTTIQCALDGLYELYKGDK